MSAISVLSTVAITLSLAAFVTYGLTRKSPVKEKLEFFALFALAMLFQLAAGYYMVWRGIPLV